MRTLKRTNLLILILTIIAFFCLPVFSDNLSSQTLQNDIAYYQRVSSQKNMTSNDRTYILDRIKEKYKDSGVDMSPLNREIAQVSQGNSAKPTNISGKDEQPAASEEQSSVTDGEESYTDPNINTAAPTQAKQAKPAAAKTKGKIEKIFISESKTESKIIIAASGVSRSNYFLMKDPSSGKPPKIVLDLYGVQNKLKKTAMNINTKKGLFSNVTSAQFEGSPNNIVRITASLRSDSAYKVRKQRGLYIIAAQKGSDYHKSEEKADAQKNAEQLPAPSPLSAVTQNAGLPSVQADNIANPVEKSTDTSNNSNIDYKVENGDILGITVYPSDELSREVIVQPDGNISFPLIGSCQAKGLTIKQLEKTMAQSLGKYISTPQVSITVKQFSRRQIFITGEVKGVGAYSYRENLRLLEFVSSLGGFTDSANRREIKIYRGPPTKRETHTVNVEEIMKSGDFSKDFLLEPGDIIEVLKGSAKVALLGDVRNPGYYDYKENMHLVELISLAGGFTDFAKITDVNIIHQNTENKQAVVKVDLKKILSGKQKDVVVQSGDTIYIPKGKFASANWFLNNFLPWLTLISLILVIRAGI